MTARDDGTDPVEARYQRLLQRMEANEGEFLRLGRAVWRVQEDERRRLARELHDGVGQNLTALKHRLAMLGAGLAPGQDALRAQLEAAIALTSATLDDTRELSRLLRPPILDDLGLEPALRWLVRSVRESSGLAVELQVDPLPALGDDASTLLFRIAQEALNNAAKHAGAARVTVRLEVRDGGLALAVEDDGIGCTPAMAARGGGSGLSGMRERLRLYGGQLQLRSAPGAGMQVLALLPAGEGDAPGEA